jgi:hypothetical protein
MNIGKACEIFMQINDEKYVNAEKVTAICHVSQMPTHNGISRKAMILVIKWLLTQLIKVWEAEE